MDNKKHLEDLSTIKSIMERSSRFISLSGLSGVFAGFCALLGGLYIYYYYGFKWLPDLETVFHSDGGLKTDHLFTLLITASLVLTGAISFGIYFTIKKAKKQGVAIWGKTSKLLLINLTIPLVTGGFFCIILLYHGAAHLVGPTTLIFYGLALLNASKFTLDEIRYLGISEILLGLIGCLYIGYALMLWIIGFGILHILYGIFMYRKYER